MISVVGLLLVMLGLFGKANVQTALVLAGVACLVIDRTLAWADSRDDGDREDW